MKLFDAVKSLFPEGTLDWRVNVEERREEKAPFARSNGSAEAWQICPADPIDLFAVCAFLLSRSGAYHHVQPETLPADDSETRRLVVTPDDRDNWSRAGKAWSASPAVVSRSPLVLTLDPPDLVFDLWAELFAAFEEPLFNTLAVNDPPPAWWHAALGLLVIADEAACDVGFLADEALQERSPPLLTLAAEYRILSAMKNLADGEGRGAYTLSDAAPDVACILPKSRTPSLGCTVRSLSHNLALLPPRGLARARWLAPVGEYTARDSTAPLNLLLVPYPYSVSASAFKACGISTSDAKSKWGWFCVEPMSDVDQAELFDFVDDLIVNARRDVGEVHGVVFPELALSGDAYSKLIDRLNKHDDIEFVAAGLHSDASGRKGNFAAATILSPRRGKQKTRRWVEDIRQKHHRWRLDNQQITSYSLGSVLDPSMGWWEKLDVLSRSLTVGVLRGETSITTLICEDLARVDPAQELLRAIGPNIVIALLMDSAQIQTRWPNRYATVLAEDPGSSVLTFTSLGLIERVNKTGFFPSNRCIALWRDDLGVRELSLPSDAHALCITLNSASIEEATLDGRADRVNALCWRLGGAQPVTSECEIPKWGA